MRNLQTNRQNENPLQKGLLRKGMKNHSGNQKKNNKTLKTLANIDKSTKNVIPKNCYPTKITQKSAKI